MIKRSQGKKIIYATVVAGLGAILVIPLSAQQSDSPQQSTPALNSLATPSPTAQPNAPRHRERKKHRRRHRGERRHERRRDESGAMTQHRQGREREQNGGTGQHRGEGTNAAAAPTPLDEKTTPENVAPQSGAVPQPTP